MKGNAEDVNFGHFLKNFPDALIDLVSFRDVASVVIFGFRRIIIGACQDLG